MKKNALLLVAVLAKNNVFSQPPHSKPKGHHVPFSLAQVNFYYISATIQCRLFVLLLRPWTLISQLSFLKSFHPESLASLLY